MRWPNFASVVHVAALYASGILYHAKGVVSTGVGNGTAEGNARGTGAVDLQTSRASAAQVASGAYSGVLGGTNNTASGASCVVAGGNNNSASGASPSAVGGGASNSASGNFSAVPGGQSNTASGSHSMAAGSSCTASSTAAVAMGAGCQATQPYSFAGGTNGKADHWGERSQSAGVFAAVGDALYSSILWRNSTSDDTQTELWTNGSTTRFTLDDDSTYVFDILVSARRTDADNESAAFRLTGCIDRNAGTTAFVGSPSANVLAEDNAAPNAWDVEIGADDTNDALTIKVTGAAGKSIRWVAHGRIVKVGG